MPKYLLDTGVIIQHLRGTKQAIRLLRHLGKRKKLAVATITRLEIHAGMRSSEYYHTQKLLSRFFTYDLDKEIADLAGDLMQRFSQQNKTIGLPDTVIAATALRHNLVVVTLNKKDFSRVPGLQLIIPE